MLTRQWLMIGGAFLTLATNSSAAGAPFYQGKTLTVIQGRTPGGTGDLRTRTVIQHLKRFLPGNPTIVSQYMPGGGGTLAANHLANVAKRDGLTIGNWFYHVCQGNPWRSWCSVQVGWLRFLGFSISMGSKHDHHKAWFGSRYGGEGQGLQGIAVCSKVGWA